MYCRNRNKRFIDKTLGGENSVSGLASEEERSCFVLFFFCSFLLFFLPIDLPAQSKGQQAQ